MLLALLVIPCLLIASPVDAQKIKTSLLLPKTEGLAKVIYDDVVAGIASHPALDISIIRLGKKSTHESVEAQIQDQHSQLVIAVGNKSYRLGKKLQTDAIVIAGGISGKPNGIPTVSLTGDPEPTLKALKRLAPHIKDIRLVYSDAVNGWWYRRATKVGAAMGIKVIGYNAEDLKQGVKLYEQLLDDALAKESAVWIPLRSIVPSKTILPLLLEKAWKKKLAVVSNNPSHAKLGGLIALYPDHKKMGRQLAQFAYDHYSGNEQNLIVGTHHLRIAINLRTSSHIGLRLSAQDRESFDKVYPQQR